ncbi:MAG TPA: hypothetical protein VFQ78_03470 [Candidatus Udaeobacter sp.]|nr:hypothetical protein [Candidatus Udaeobacter sp.]
MPTLGAARQQHTSANGSEALSDKPVISATPEHVKLTNGNGSTQIQWNTGKELSGFVFVTQNGAKPVLFAKGATGSRVARWIGNKRYVFELYGDDQRRMLLAKVVVSGFTESISSEPVASWRGVRQWGLILVLAVVLYLAVYLSSTGPLRTTFPTEPSTSPQPLHVGRNLLLAIAAFLCVDGIIFHSGLYVSILAPDSYAGRVAESTRAENERATSGLKQVLVLGDSRMAEGFSSTLANELGSSAGLEFISLAEPAASANTWYYMVREVDPTSRRYWAIVIPYGIGYEPKGADALRISMTAPLLRYRDCFSFASGFQRWSGRLRAFTASILRGLAYQDDVIDLLEHPLARMRDLEQEGARMHSRAAYKGRDYDLVGTTYDPATGQVTFPARLTEAQRLAFLKSLIQPSSSETEYSIELQREWIPRIMKRYAKSLTAIVLTPVPRGPFVELPVLSRRYDSVLPDSVIQKSAFSLPEHTFDFLEKPEYYFDAFHLNAKGRQRFTERVVSELMGRVLSANWKPQHKVESQLVVNPPRGTETH